MTKMNFTNISKNTLQFLIKLTFIIYLWHLVSIFANSDFLPSPFKIIVKVYTSLEFGAVAVNTLATFGTCILSMVLAMILAIIVGLVVYQVKVIRDNIRIIIDFFRGLPQLSYYPLFALLFGINTTSRIITVTFGIFWILLFGFINSLGQLSQVKIKYLRSIGGTSLGILRHYIIYDLYVNWRGIIKICLSISLFVTVALEMYGGSEYGLGKAIVESKNYYEIELMYFWIVVTGTVGAIFNKIVD
jgi:taurine transport system permease protein